MSPEGQIPSARERTIELYTRYSEELLGFLRSMLPVSKEDARDLLQHVFLDVTHWVKCNPGVAIEHPRGFLYELARRRLIKHRNKLDRTPTHLVDDDRNLLEVNAAAQADDLEHLTAQGQERRLLLRAMRKLGSAHPVDELQVIVYLRFWVGMTKAEIGRVLGLKRGAVIRRLRKAIAQLRALLQEFEEQDPHATRTSTALLLRWLRQLEHEAATEAAGADRTDE